MRTPPEITLHSQSTDAEILLWSDGVIQVTGAQADSGITVCLSRRQTLALAAWLEEPPKKESKDGYPEASYFRTPKAGPRDLAARDREAKR